MAVEVLESYEGPFWLWVGSGIVALVLCPIFFWNAFLPPPFDLAPYSKTVDYEFRDLDYAEAFAALNGGTVD